MGGGENCSNRIGEELGRQARLARHFVGLEHTILVRQMERHSQNLGINIPPSAEIT